MTVDKFVAAVSAWMDASPLDKNLSVTWKTWGDQPAQARVTIPPTCIGPLEKAWPELRELAAKSGMLVGMFVQTVLTETAQWSMHSGVPFTASSSQTEAVVSFRMAVQRPAADGIVLTVVGGRDVTRTLAEVL